MKLVFFRDRKKQWRWHLLASNSKIVASAGEGYARRRDCANTAWKYLNVQPKGDGALIREGNVWVQRVAFA